MLPDDSIISVDTGNHAHYFAAFYPVRSGGRFLNPGGWTPMGWGPTAIIGAKLAQPDKACVAITGDGGFLMVNQEVSTAVEWGLPVVWLVFNNSSLAAIRDGQLADFGGRIIGTEYTVEVDYAVLGRALGAEGVRVTHHDEVEDAIRWALDCGRPVRGGPGGGRGCRAPADRGRVVRARPRGAGAHAARLGGAILSAPTRGIGLMRRFKYAYSALVYYGEDIGASIDRVARFGYDGIELLGQPETYDAPAVRRRAADAGIGVSSISSVISADRDFANPDPDIRQNALAYLELTHRSRG